MRSPPIPRATQVVFAAAVGACAVTSCSLVRDFDALTRDTGSSETEAGSSSGSDGGDARAPSDATATQNDARADAGGGPCPALAGGAMVHVGQPGAEFCIDQTEVTRAQYDAFLRTNPKSASHAQCAFKTGSATPCTTLDPKCSSFIPTEQVTGAGWPYTPAEADLPVAFVDWCDAYAYCEWAGKRLCGQIGGGSLANADRLDVSKNQWLQACSRNGQLAFSYGNTFVEGTCNVTPGRVYPAKSQTSCQGGYPNVFDMSGNVFEWIDLCVAQSSPLSDQCFAWGGSYTSPSEASCTFLTRIDRDRRFDNVGFRCCGP